MVLKFRSEDLAFFWRARKNVRQVNTRIMMPSILLRPYNNLGQIYVLRQLFDGEDEIFLNGKPYLNRLIKALLQERRCTQLCKIPLNNQTYRTIIFGEVDLTQTLFWIGTELLISRILLRPWQNVSVDVLFGKEMYTLVCNRLLCIFFWIIIQNNNKKKMEKTLSLSFKSPWSFWLTDTHYGFSESPSILCLTGFCRW